MKVTRTSTYSGRKNTMDLPVTREELDRLEHEHVQRVFPRLSADQREFLISGTTPEEWEELFGSES